MGSRHDYAENGNTFAFLAHIRVCLIVIGGETSSKKGNGSSFLNSRPNFVANQCVPSPPNNIIVGFWYLKGIFRT